MNQIVTNFRLPALISSMLVLPLMLLEWINRRDFYGAFPILLFGILWLLPMAFILILMPIVRNVRAGNSLMVNPISPLLKVALLILIAWLWVSLMFDQMPCFLGVPNCD
jgi:hypothetical protein